MSDAVDFFKGKAVLVTGAGGYLGQNLVAALAQTDCRIVRVLRRESPTPPVSGSAEVVAVRAPLDDPAAWDRNLEGIEVVFHLAAQTSAYVANDDPIADHAVNVMPMLQLLEACRRRGSRPAVCFSSTVTVAGIPERLPVDESHPDHPLTVYDLHKQMAELYLRWYSEQGHVRGVTLRLANVYGPGPRSSRADRGILNLMMRKALAGEELIVYGAGDQVRDYVYIDDVTRAFLAAARHAEALSGERFVIGSGQGHSIAEAIGMVAARSAARTGKTARVRQVEPPATLSPIERRNFVADIRRFSAATGWHPRYALAEGIELTLEAFS